MNTTDQIEKKCSEFSMYSKVQYTSDYPATHSVENEGDIRNTCMIATYSTLG